MQELVFIQMTFKKYNTNFYFENDGGIKTTIVYF